MTTNTAASHVSRLQIYWGIILYPCSFCDSQGYCTSWEEATDYHPADVENWSCEYFMTRSTSSAVSPYLAVKLIEILSAAKLENQPFCLEFGDTTV